MNFLEIKYGRHCVAGWVWRREAHTHPSHTLWCICGGTGTLQVGDKAFMLCRGDIFYLNYQESIVGMQDERNPLHVQYVNFLPDSMEDISHFALHKKSAPMGFMLSLFERIQVSLQKNKEDASLWLQALLLEYQSLEPAHAESKYSAEMDLLCERIRQTPGGEYSISALAKEMGLSTDHFIRIFKKETGQSPYAFLQQARLELAQSCLHSSAMSVAQIAVSCGFSDVYAFSKFFKSGTGYSPIAYRKSL